MGYEILLYVLAGFAALVLLIGFGLALVVTLIVTHPVKKARPGYQEIKELNIKLGHVDYDAYDQMEKEIFKLPSSGAEINCVLIPASEPPCPGRPAKCLITAHGFGLNLMTSVRYISVFREMGYAVLIYDQRSFGESSGTCSLGYFERQDMAALAAWARRRLGEDTIIGLHGESLGAITTLEALGLVEDVAFAVSDSGPTSFYAIYRAGTHLPVFPFLSALNQWAKLRYGVDVREVRPIDKVAETEVPILFIHGTLDKPIPYRESEKLFAAAKNPLSRLELFEGVWHTGAHMLEPERYERVVREFVRAAEEVRGV